MINIQKMIELAAENGYQGDDAAAKVCQDIAYDDGASLLISSDEQMFAEKLRSLLKFGSLSTRFKDVYDMYYLKDRVDMTNLSVALDTYIFQDGSMREKEGRDIVKSLKFSFRDKIYIST